MKKLALFDMDGTIFDTSRVNYLSYKGAAKKLGYNIDEKSFMQVFTGRNYKEFLPVFGITGEEELQFVHEEKKKLYPIFLAEAKENVFVTDIIKNLPCDYVKGLVTTASKKNVEDILTAFKLQNVFDFVITQEDSKKLKPDPEAYLVAMERAGITANNTVIFEDSEAGIQAAFASGASVLQIRRF